MAVERWNPFPRSIERWDPFRDLSEIKAEMNRFFDTFFGRPMRIGLDDRAWAPVVDVYETTDELVVSVELPGVNEKGIQVSMTGDLLTIKGERRQERETKDENYRRLERFYGKFERNIPVPAPVQSDKIKATYRNGLLEIHLPKAEEVKPKEINIETL